MTNSPKLKNGIALEEIVREVCLYQAFNNCKPCTYDAINNPKCPNYYGIKLRSLEVKDENL